MAKTKHYSRQGTDPGAARDIAYNGAVRAGGPFPLAHPDMQSPPASFTGFAADGGWRQFGQAVSPALTTELGDAVHALDTNKWTPWGSIPYIQASAYLKASASALGTKATFGGNGWVIRGGFDIELEFSATLPEALAGQENVVFLEVESQSVTFRAKLIRENDIYTFVAASVTGVGSLLGKANTTDTNVRLSIRREVNNTTLNIAAIGEDNGYFLLWTGAAAGEMVVRFGMETSVDTAWNTVFGKFTHRFGNHTFSSTASWSRESSDGVVHEEFVGDQLSERWTVATTGNAAVAAGSHDTLTERGLLMSSAVGAGTADVEYTPISGDFEAAATIHWSKDAAHAQGNSSEEIGWGFEIRSQPTGYPRHRVSVIRKLAGWSLSTILRVESWATQGGPPVSLASDDTLPIDTSEMSYLVTFLLLGDALDITVHDVKSDRQVAFVSFDGASVPTAPWSPAFFMESGASGVTSAAALPFAVKTLESMTGGVLPASYHVLSCVAHSTELQDYDTNLTADVCAVRLIDTPLQTPSFGLSGLSKDAGGADFDQALPGGIVGDVWSSPAGVMWIPVGRTGVAQYGGFIGVDFKADKIYRVREGELAVFNGHVADRNLCLGYASPSPASNSPAEGRPIRVQTKPATALVGGGFGQDVTAWVTDHAVKVYDAQAGSAVALFENADPGTNGVTEVLRGVLVDPPTPDGATTYGKLVVAATRKDDVAVAVYRDASSIVGQGAEATPGAHANVIYTGSPPVAAVNSGFVTGKLPGPASAAANSILDLDAKDGAGGLVFAVARGSDGGGLVFDDSADAKAWLPANVVTDIPTGSLSFSPVAVRLTGDAAPTAGHIAFATAAEIVVGGVTHHVGSAEVSAIASGRIRYKTDAGDVHASLAAFSDVRSTAASLALVESPPDGGSGVTLAWGTESAGSHIVFGITVSMGGLESTVLAVIGLPASDSHVGGEPIAITGEGLDSLASVTVGGVPCFRVTVNAGVSPQQATFAARALGWPMSLDEPAVPDIDLESTPSRVYDVVLRFRDGATITFPASFTYTSELCAERTLHRMLGRIPEEVLPNHPKENTWQRHIVLSVALQLCRVQNRFLAVIEDDTFIATSTAGELRHLGGMYTAPEPAGASMTDANMRKYVRAAAFGSRVTVRAIKDILEPIFGARPTVAEGYREFTVTVPLAVSISAAFFSDVADPDDSTGAYYNRDFYAGADPRIAAASAILDARKAAGVKYIIIIEEPT